MKLVSLSQLSNRIHHGGTPSKEIHLYWNGNIPWISSADIDGSGFINITRYITEEGLKNSAANLVPEGSMIIVNRVGVGKAAIAPFDLCFSQDCIGIILNEKIVDANYCIRMLKGELYKLRSRTRGTTIQGITKKDIENTQIPLPPLYEQIQIAKILTQAETLIAQRKESIRLLDELVKSKFLEMFGDPVKNEKGWEVKRLGDYIFDIIAGSSYGGESTDQELSEDEFGVIKVSAVTWGTFNPKEFKVVKKNNLKGKVYHPKKDDLLFSRANTKELVGATCIVDKDYPKLFLPDKIWNIKLKESELQKVFLHYLLKNNSFRKILTKDATGTSGSMLNISMDKFQNVLFCKPPFDLQIEFTELVNSIQRQKELCQESLRRIESLYASLSQKAFRGELAFEKENVALNEIKLLDSDVVKKTVSLPKKRTAEKTKKPKIVSVSPDSEKEEKFFLKRKILGSYIINESLEDSHLGDVKFEKLLHLCEYHILKRNLGQHYVQKVAGPYDNKFTIPFFQQIERDRWFLRLKKGKQFFFKPGEKHDSSMKTYNYFSEGELSGIKSLIQMFRKTDFEKVEIVSTLYAVWNNRIIKGEPIADALLKDDFLNWAPEKIRYKDRVDGALAWMREKGIVPDGWGPLIEKAG